MRITVTARGQLVLPARIREQDGIEAGQVFDVERIAAGEYRLQRRSVSVNGGLVDWLLECPEKGWFMPVESDSTGKL